MDVDEWTKALARRIGAIAEVRQRAVVFAGAVAEIDPPCAALAFQRILSWGFGRRDRNFKLLTDAAMLAVAHDLWQIGHRLRAFNAASAETNRLTRIFLAPIAFLHSEQDEARFKVPDYGLSRPLTLGERRSIAMRPSRRLIEYAAMDPHPMVIAKLLDNPKLTESDIIRMAARRPASVRTLVEIGLHPKWRCRPRVASALVRNPWMRVDISLTLLPNLSPAEMREIVADALLPRRVRDAGAELLDCRNNRKREFAPKST